MPPGVEHIAFRLTGRAEPEENPHLEFVLRDPAANVASLGAEGHEVLVRCVAAESRTPAVGIAYALALGVPFEASRDAVCAALPAAPPNAAFLRTLAGPGVESYFAVQEYIGD